MLPTDGKIMSGVVVPTAMNSMSSGTRLARSIACCAARTARSEVASLSSAMRRSWMPLRCTIHSSLVSTIFSRSALLRIRLGAYAPTPVILARIIRVPLLDRLAPPRLPVPP